MILNVPLWATPYECKPRASGDDPPIDHHDMCPAAVNPARAGMILSVGKIFSRIPRKPRASGDDPTASVKVEIAKA